MKITLSFDNGPDPEVTPFVLDRLARHEIKTTFFVVGDKLRDPGRFETARRAHAEGHWIGNHTFNHLVPFGRGRYPEISPSEISRTQELIGDLAHPGKLFRPFGGGGFLNNSLLDAPAVDYLVVNHFTCVLWNAVPRDWEDPKNWVATAIQQCGELKWALLVLHDLPTGAMEHLDRFIDEINGRGGSFVQDFPPDCVPIVRGKITSSIDEYVASRA